MITSRKIFIASAVFAVVTVVAGSWGQIARAQNVSADYFATDEPQVLGESISVDPGLTGQTTQSYLANFHCFMANCDAEIKNFVAEPSASEKLFAERLGDAQGTVEQKEQQIAKQRDDLIALREYRKSQDDLAAKSAVPEAPCATGKCVLVSIKRQKMWAFEDGQVAISSLVSTGVRGHDTPTGTFHIYGKTRSQKMSGPGYYLPNVPYIMWIKGDYSFHGTYWHHNFGHPMSHGCVNLPTPIAEQLFNWGYVGLPVTITAS